MLIDRHARHIPQVRQRVNGRDFPTAIDVAEHPVLSIVAYVRTRLILR
jgi:hypothetical protein